MRRKMLRKSVATARIGSDFEKVASHSMPKPSFRFSGWFRVQLKIHPIAKNYPPLGST
ncbi:hypothetical protein [Pseudolysobacter antarcticus]|uniref:hypothetical protein n=1 Tax=Pseudolysobacter antarcticus TaxID=2511995 RepID=UPI0013ED13E6|nr:hypothetical protein [Pseudolysobacter antarcticus]